MDTQKMIDIAKYLQWRQGKGVDDIFVIVGGDFAINCGNEAIAEFVANAPRVITQLAQVQANHPPTGGGRDGLATGGGGESHE